MSQEDFDEKVIQQRNWELCFEESTRWFDLVRKQILDEKILEENRQNFSEDDYRWPIPLYVLRNDHILTQNPGYENPYN